MHVTLQEGDHVLWYQNIERYLELITRKHDAFFVDTPHNERPSIAKFDNYLYS